MDMVTITRSQYERDIAMAEASALRSAAGEMRRILMSGKTLGMPSDEWLHECADRIEERATPTVEDLEREDDEDDHDLRDRAEAAEAAAERAAAAERRAIDALDRITGIVADLRATWADQ